MWFDPLAPHVGSGEQLAQAKELVEALTGQAAAAGRTGRLIELNVLCALPADAVPRSSSHDIQ